MTATHQRLTTVLAPLTRWSLLLLLALFASACGDDHDHDNEAEAHDPAEEACEHMIDGPSSTITLAADTSGTAGVDFEHKRLDAALIESAGQQGGVLTLEIAEAGDYLIFLDQDVPITFEDAAGTALAIEATEQVTTCAEVSTQHTVELGVGLNHIIVGPADVQVISLVIEHLEGEHDHADH